MTTATIYHGDARTIVPMLRPAPAMFTSLPDAAETGQDLTSWKEDFYEFARLCIAHTDPHGVAIFYQTDRRVTGRLVCKDSIIVAAAASVGANVLWHKVAVHTTGTSLYRPAYSHLIAVSSRGKAGRPTPDVYTAGPKHYPNAIDRGSLNVGFDFLDGLGVDHVVDPFAGRGSVARYAAAYGWSSTSVEIDAGQVEAFVTNVGAAAPVHTSKGRVA